MLKKKIRYNPVLTSEFPIVPMAVPNRLRPATGRPAQSEVAQADRLMEGRVPLWPASHPLSRPAAFHRREWLGCWMGCWDDHENNP